MEEKIKERVRHLFIQELSDYYDKLEKYTNIYEKAETDEEKTTVLEEAMKNEIYPWKNGRLIFTIDAFLITHRIYKKLLDEGFSEDDLHVGHILKLVQDNILLAYNNKVLDLEFV